MKLIYPESETWLGSVDHVISGLLIDQSGVVEQEVLQRTLDSYLANLQNRRVLVKIDTEGHEYSVLQGAWSVVQRCRPLVIFECWGTETRQKLREFFRQSNYQLYRLPWSPTEGAAALTDRDFIDSAQTNFIAVPSN